MAAGAAVIDQTNDTTEHDVFDDAKRQARGLKAKMNRIRAEHLSIVEGEKSRVEHSRAVLAGIEADAAARIAASQAALDKAEEEAEQSRLVISQLEPLFFPNGRSDVTCCLCLSDVAPTVAVRPCGHADFCGECLQKWWLNPVVEKKCPLCRAAVHAVDFL